MSANVLKVKNKVKVSSYTVLYRILRITQSVLHIMPYIHIQSNTILTPLARI